MIEYQAWRDIGWDNTFWELVRYYCSLKARSKARKTFVDDLYKKNTESEIVSLLGLSEELIDRLTEYLEYREKRVTEALSYLRTEDQGKKFCENIGQEWGITATQSQDHHQSSKVMVAAVTAVAESICNKYKITLNANPQGRCVWKLNGQLHVSARRLDGAIPGLENPYVVWEIKEYWGKKNGGSKMSDAVYECQLVGKEIREYENRCGSKITHLVFLDGKIQWESRVSDLARFIDLEAQGLIDYLFVGSRVEKAWGTTLQELLD